MSSDIFSYRSYDHEIAIRMRELVGDRRGDAADAALRWGVSSGYLSNCLSGARRPTKEFLARIAQVDQVSLDWLILGIGPMRRDPEVEALAERISRLPEMMRVTLTTTVAALAETMEPAEGDSPPPPNDHLVMLKRAPTGLR